MIQHTLVGTWVVDFGSDSSMTNVIHSDGKFEAVLRDMRQVIKYEGTVTAKDGALVYLRTKSSSTNSVVPAMMTGQIIHLDDRELVAKWGAFTNTVVAIKIEP